MEHDNDHNDIMKPSFPHLLLMCILLVSPSFAGETRPAPTPNAAVGYLLAIGWMDSLSPAIGNELRDLDSLEAFAKLSPETLRYLDGRKLVNVIRMVKEGSKCDLCQFYYDRTFRPDEPVPPYRRIRELARVVRAIGFYRLSKKREDEALDSFQALFRLGRHMEQDGLLISGMIGHAVKVISLTGFKALLEVAAKPGVKARARDFLKSLPPSTSMTRSMIEWEKKFALTALDMIKNDPNPSLDGIEEFMRVVSPNPGKKEPTSQELAEFRAYLKSPEFADFFRTTFLKRKDMSPIAGICYTPGLFRQARYRSVMRKPNHALPG